EAMKLVSVRRGVVLPLAARANTPIAKLYGTNSSLWTKSCVAPCGALSPVAAPASARMGAMVPLADRAYTVTELLPALATTNSSWACALLGPTLHVNMSTPTNRPMRQPLQARPTPESRGLIWLLLPDEENSLLP